MAKILVEISCKGKYCNTCKHGTFIRASKKWFCNIFWTKEALKVSRKNDEVLRCKECLEAQKAAEA